jgi:hypothetical protein
MILRPSDVGALTFVSGRHPDRELTVTIMLMPIDPNEPRTSYLSIYVYGVEPTARYIATDDGDVYESANGHTLTTLAHRAKA